MRMTDLGQLALGGVDFVEKQDDRRAWEPLGVDNVLEQDQTPPSGSKGRNRTSEGVRNSVKAGDLPFLIPLTVPDRSR